MRRGWGYWNVSIKKSVVAIEWAEKALEFLSGAAHLDRDKKSQRERSSLFFHIPAEFEHVIKKFK